MKPEFNIRSHHSAGNLHISLFGAFNGMCAWELFKIIRRRYAGSGRVFVSTAGLSGVDEAGVRLFKTHMTRTPLPPDWLYFKGAAGFQIAPDGCRVLIVPKCGRPQRHPGPARIAISPRCRTVGRIHAESVETTTAPRRNS